VVTEQKIHEIAGRLDYAIDRCMSALPALRQADIALQQIRRLDDALDQEPHHRHPGDPFAAGSPLRLELRGVGHHYPGKTDDAQFFLGPMDLTIGRGEILFIAGGNGSGKTTLAMLLLGLYEPEQGTILLNGVPVTPSNITAYRTYFSAVFADFHLFQHLLSADEKLYARATEYLEMFGIAHKVNITEGKFSTIDLSTGQRKRLALVSAFLEDRQIYLFDE
jgi:putative ATP-binding cassette transporter